MLFNKEDNLWGATDGTGWLIIRDEKLWENLRKPFALREVYSEVKKVNGLVSKSEFKDLKFIHFHTGKVFDYKEWKKKLDV